MSKSVLEIENVSKQYRLGEVGTGTLTHDLNRWWASVRGKEDPYLKIGETNDRTQKGETDYVWALKDINFKVEQGEAVGIIGRNGAGKSTLLKLLSKVTKPTTGTIKYRGRIASLLEVGTGFHPEMTGRENIYLNGAILGMTRKEITRKFDEIVAFAGVERYIDTPVKRYSSGMYVRLAFAVAAHLESEILIVDEVLAVGDVEFQRKCIGKMNDVSKGEGRTVLFVSHNMASIQNLCDKGVLMQYGKIEAIGEINEVVDKYLTLNNDDVKKSEYLANLEVDLTEHKPVQIKKAFLKNNNGAQIQKVIAGDSFEFHIEYKAYRTDLNSNLYIGIYDQYDQKLLHLGTIYGGLEIFKSQKQGLIVCKIPKCTLKEGIYSVNLSFHIDNSPVERVKNAFTLNVENGDFYNVGKLPNNKENIFFIDQKWETF